MSLFIWASSWDTTNARWQGASWLPTVVQSRFDVLGVPTAVTKDNASAPTVYPGQRLRATIRVTNTDDTPAAVRLLYSVPDGEGFLPAATWTVANASETQVFQVERLWDRPEGRLRARLEFYGATTMVVNRVEVDLVTNIDPYVRSYDTDDGTRWRLNAYSEPGDLAILAMASQYGDTAAQPPAGWTQVHTTSGAPRAGYVAYKVVESRTDTVDITHRVGDDSAARKRGLLMVLKGNPGTPTIGGWQPDAFDLPAGYHQVLLSQRHSVANAPSGDWEPRGGGVLLGAGEASATASWSRLAGAYTTSAHSLPENEAPQMWGRVLLEPPGRAPRVSVLREGGERPARVRRFPSGASSVSSLLATEGFWVAHRGGSYSWPESSMLAYTQAASRGAPALEVSCHRTADGVWFLSHDVNLTRVDPTAPAKDVREMTWAEVSRYTTLGRPIVRWDDLREAYARDFVIFLDPKNSALEWRSLVEGMDKDKTVLKFSADAVWLAQQWKADGWTTWGYMYESQLPSGKARQWADTGYWDLLGMEYTAAQDTWTEVLSWGRPVLGHIAPDDAAYRTALSKGASGVMLAGVASLVPEGV